MKVFLMVPEMHLGGVEEGTFDLARGMKHLGIDITILSGYGNYVPLIEKEKIKWINLPTSKKTPAIFCRCLKKLKSILRIEKPDILHCRSRFPAWIGYYALKGNKKTRFITSIHGFYGCPFYSKILARGQRVIVISDFLGKFAVEKLGANPGSVRVVHNGIRFDPYVDIKPEKHDGFIIAGIGRLTELKGFQYLIKAFAIAKKSEHNIKLWIIGDGPYKKQLEILNTELQTDALFLTGRASDFLSRIDLLVAPHVETETMVENMIPWLGRSVYEAQLAEVPVVTTLNGIKDGTFIKTDTGILCKPADIEAMSEAIIFTVRNQEKMKEMAKRGKKFVMNHFSIEQMIEKTVKVYREVLEN